MHGLVELAFVLMDTQRVERFVCVCVCVCVCIFMCVCVCAFIEKLGSKMCVCVCLQFYEGKKEYTHAVVFSLMSSLGAYSLLGVSFFFWSFARIC